MKKWLEIIFDHRISLRERMFRLVTGISMVALLFILGVSSIREFAAPLMVGILCGAYSSVCITGALWYVMKTRQLEKKGK